jgi:hypothetical protein
MVDTQYALACTTHSLEGEQTAANNIAAIQTSEKENGEEERVQRLLFVTAKLTIG